MPKLAIRTTPGLGRFFSTSVRPPPTGTHALHVNPESTNSWAMATTTDTNLMVKTWNWLCEEPMFDGVPYRFEVAANGQITMSPTKNPHGITQFRIGELMRAQALGGEVGVEIATITPKKMYSVDVAWCKEPSRLSEQEYADPAADICVEVRSPSNTDSEFTNKRAAYFAAGAREVWFVDATGKVSFFAAKGVSLPRSQIMPKFPTSVR